MKKGCKNHREPNTPQRERFCMLWGNPVIFTDCREIIGISLLFVNITGFLYNIQNMGSPCDTALFPSLLQKKPIVHSQYLPLQKPHRLIRVFGIFEDTVKLGNKELFGHPKTVP